MHAHDSNFSDDGGAADNKIDVTAVGHTSTTASSPFHSSDVDIDTTADGRTSTTATPCMITIYQMLWH